MKLPYEITPENLPKMEKFIRRKLYWAKKRRVIQILSAPVAQILYFFGILSLSFGIMTQFEDFIFQ